MGKNKSVVAVTYALLAAVFYAINTPFSKVLLNVVPPTFMASFLYLGAGLGVGIMYLFHFKKEEKTERLNRLDLPYTIGMIVLDILAPIFLMLGISIGSASNASLLGNFEIVATTVIALLIFKEKVSKELWTAIAFITLSSIILSFEGSGSFQFSLGSLFVILATTCWGLENNCTRKISNKSSYEIVVIKRTMFWRRLFPDCIYKRRARSRYKICISCHVIRLCSIWLKYFPLCQGPKRSRSSQDKCILCSGSFCRGISGIHHKWREPYLDVFCCLDFYGDRKFLRCLRYNGQTPYP